MQKLSGMGIGVLITDHNVRDTLEITHRSYIINLGEIVVRGARDELLAERARPPDLPRSRLPDVRRIRGCQIRLSCGRSKSR